jgi:hypothetical protein
VCGENGSLRDLHHVLWEVPLGILAQMVHVKLRAQGVWTIEPLPPIAPQATATLQAAQAAQQRVQW